MQYCPLIFIFAATFKGNKMKTTRKIIQALTYIAYKQPNHTINSMKAYKLLWLADRYHLRQYGRTITDDIFYALPHGVVPSDAKNVIEHQPTHMKHDLKYSDCYIHRVDKYNYQALKEPDTMVFSDSDQDSLDKVLRSYGFMDQYQLESLSHDFPEWLAYKDKIETDHSPKAYKINLDFFFQDVQKDQSGLFEDEPEKLALTKEMFHEFSPR